MNPNTNPSERASANKMNEIRFARHPELTAYGWDERWDDLLGTLAGVEAGWTPGRIVAQHSHSYQLMTIGGERTATVSGKYAYAAVRPSDFPAVGDWVLAEPMPGESRCIIHALLPRRTAMTRRAAGNVDAEQVIGANVDTLFLTSALNLEFNVRRIERFLIAAWESGASPVVLLTKADLCPDPEALRAQVELAAPGVPVHIVSALRDEGMDDLAPYLRPGSTIAVAGSSGVGKSTLLNWLSGGSRMSTSGIREADARGRHTTTHRELFALPGGALVMDTPGMRELQLWDSQDGWQQAFADVEALAARCRFRDCRHEAEAAGCAVAEAIAAGELDAARLANYKKTARELERQANKASKTPSKSPKANKSPSPSRSRKHRSRYEDEAYD